MRITKRSETARKRPAWLFALLAMLLVLAVEQVIEHFARRFALEHEKISVHEHLSTVRARLEGVISANLLLVHGLTAVISAQPDIDQAGFSRIASSLVDQRHALRNIAGAPGMVISLMYPLEGNEAAIGLDFRTHPTQRDTALRAMATGRPVIAGPLRLQQGSIGIIARAPVYVPGRAPGEPARFWGLVSAVIDADVLYQLAGLEQTSTRLHLAIRGVDGSGAQGAVFYGDAAVFAQAPVVREITIPGGTWQIAATPAGGWGRTSEGIWLIRLLGALAALAAGAMAYRMAQGARALSATAARMRSLLDTIPDLVWMKDPNGVYLACNPRFESLYGAREADIVGKTDRDFVSAELADQFQANDRAAIESGGPRGNEEWLTFASDGHKELAETIKTPVHDQDGNLLGVLGIARDITGRKQAEEKIQGLNRVYAVLSGINESIVRLRDPDALFREACRIAVEVGSFHMAWLGMADPGGGRVVPVASAGIVDGYLERVHISLGEDEHGRGPTGTALKQGQHVVCNDIANDPRMGPWREAALALGYRASAALPIRVGGQVRGSFNLYAERAGFFDETELRLLDELALDIGFALEFMQAENALREQETFFRLTAENMGDMVAVLDLDGRRLYNSPSYAALFGDTDALLGTDSFAEIHPEDRELVRQAFRKTVETGVGQRLNFRFVLVDGSVREMESQGGVIRGADGKVERVVVVSRDITERKRMEDEIRHFNAELEERVRERTAQLAAANKELETFTYSVSHDLKAPLRGIDGYSRLLLEDHLDQLDEEGRQFLGNVRHGVEQMSQLIEDLLAYSRMERRDLHGIELDLPRQVAGILNERQADLAAQGVEVHLDLAAPGARADPDGLNMVLRNLIDNAVKFSRDSRPPVLEIKSVATPESTILSIRDNGIGFDMKFQARIFEIFQRLQRAEDYPGTGVGLAIVRKAMQRMGGRVWAESAPGQGATFFLELPR